MIGLNNNLNTASLASRESLALPTNVFHSSRATRLSVDVTVQFLFLTSIPREQDHDILELLYLMKLYLINMQNKVIGYPETIIILP